MAAKRRFDESSSDCDPGLQPDEKRMRNNSTSTSTRPSFAAVISQVVMVKSLQNFCSALEPLLRRVVKEEVEDGLRRHARFLNRSPSLRIQALETSTLQLIFKGELSLPVFTGTKMEDVDSNPLQILLVDTGNGKKIQTSLPYPIKIEIVALDGDFPQSEQENWTVEEFNNKIVKERTGKRPLVAGDVIVTVRDGFAIIGDLSFTDNSSWIRGRHFRLGARISPESSYQGPRIREAITEPFMVKDHRGELYKKHYPPSLDDEVWRLEKIGKDGAFHRKLAAEGINKVQDFLKLWVVFPGKLRKILGIGMSDKAWEVTIKHAKTCSLGNKRYIFQGQNCIVVLNPICQVVRVMPNGQTADVPGIQRARVEQMVWDAFMNWSTLEEVDELVNEIALLPPPSGNELRHPNHYPDVVRPSHHPQRGNQMDGLVDVTTLLTDEIVHVHYDDWPQNLMHFSPPMGNYIGYNTSDSSSDDCS